MNSIWKIELFYSFMYMIIVENYNENKGISTKVNKIFQYDKNDA